MSTPAAVSLSDLVPLMYRARWLQCVLSGEVTSREEGAGFAGRESGSLAAAPGGRYRAEVVDEDGDRDLMICDGLTGVVPFGELLIPSRLLADYELAVDGRAEHVGRTVYVVRAVRRGGQLRPGWPADRVTALVDAELGILLRYEETSQTGRVRVIEFTSLSVGPAHSADPLLFTQPAGDLEQDSRGDHDAAEPGPARPPTAPELTDEQVNLLYRTTLGPQRFAAVLREQEDRETILQRADEALAATKLGSRTRWLWQVLPRSTPDEADWEARLTVAMPGRYRIEMITDPRFRPASIASDGEHLWRIYPDRVAVRPAGRLPGGIGSIIDPAWLLDSYRLSVQDTVTVSGRPGLPILAVPEHWPSPMLRQGLLQGPSAVTDEIEVTVDTELGITLRQVWSCQGHPVLRSELSSVTTDIDPDAFLMQPPPGARIITGGLLAETGMSPAEIALHAAKAASKLAVEIGRRWIRNSRR